MLFRSILFSDTCSICCSLVYMKRTYCLNECYLDMWSYKCGRLFKGRVNCECYLMVIFIVLTYWTSINYRPASEIEFSSIKLRLKWISHYSFRYNYITSYLVKSSIRMYRDFCTRILLTGKVQEESRKEVDPILVSVFVLFIWWRLGSRLVPFLFVWSPSLNVEPLKFWLIWGSFLRILVRDCLWVIRCSC